MVLIIVSALAEFQGFLVGRFGKKIDLELLVAFSKMLNTITDALLHPPKE